jgi:hypothetical protein
LICVNAGVDEIGKPRRDRVTCRCHRGKIMTRLMTVVLLAASLGLFACAETGTYPLGEDQCKPTDPVQTMDASDCIVPGS